MLLSALSPIDWLVVLLIALLVFGPGKLADIGKGFGEGIRNFKSGLKGGDAPPAPPASTPPAEKK
jgi:sec-independent protein translocase protein TatA